MCSSYEDILNMAWHWVRDLKWNQNSKKRLCIPILKIPAFHFRDLCVRKKILLYKLKMYSSGCILCKALNMERDVGKGHCLCSRLRNSPMRSSIPRALSGCFAISAAGPLLSCCLPAVSQYLENRFRFLIAWCPAELWNPERRQETAKLHWIIIRLWGKISCLPHIDFLGRKSRMTWMPAIS